MRRESWPEEMETQKALVYTGVSVGTLRKYYQDGFLEPTREENKGSGVRRWWRKSDLDRILFNITEQKKVGWRAAKARWEEHRGITITQEAVQDVEEIPLGATAETARQIFRENLLRSISQKDLMTGLVKDLQSTDHKERSEARKFILTFLNKDGGRWGEEESPELDGIMGILPQKAEAEVQVLEEE